MMLRSDKRFIELPNGFWDVDPELGLIRKTQRQKSGMRRKAVAKGPRGRHPG